MCFANRAIKKIRGNNKSDKAECFIAQKMGKSDSSIHLWKASPACMFDYNAALTLYIYS